MTRFLHRFWFPATAAAALVLSTGEVVGQTDLTRYAPKPLPESGASDAAMPEGEMARAFPEEDTELLPELKAIILVPSPGDAVRNPQPPDQAVQRVPAFEMPGGNALSEKLARHVGEPLTFRSLNQIAEDIILHYRAAGRPVVDVAVPEQDITAGAVQFVVLEARTGGIRATGNRFFSSDLLTRRIRLAPGEPIDVRILTADLDFLNRNPFRQVNTAFTPGDTTGITDIELLVEDRLPLRGYVGFDNAGFDTTGREQLFGGFNWGNAFGLDHVLSYQYTTTTDFDSVQAHSVFYEIPLPWRHTLQVFGAYADSDYGFDLDGEHFDVPGQSAQASGRYELDLPEIGPVTHRAVAGFDFKQTDNDLLFGGMSVFPTTTEIYQFVAGYRATGHDDLGVTNFRADLFWSPGGWSADNSDEAFEAARAFASADYLYARAMLERTTRLPADFTCVIRATGQVSNANLLPSEQIAAGGFDSVRGYDEREVRGDEGFILSVELRTPPLPVLSRFGVDQSDSLQGLAFWDYGLVGSRTRLPEEPDDFGLQSIGIGVRYGLSENASLRFDYGWQIEETGFTDENSRAHVSVMLSY